MGRSKKRVTPGVFHQEVTAQIISSSISKCTQDRYVNNIEIEIRDQLLGDNNFSDAGTFGSGVSLGTMVLNKGSTSVVSGNDSSQTGNKFSIDHSIRGTAKCKVCKKIIPKDELRIGKSVLFKENL